MIALKKSCILLMFAVYSISSFAGKRHKHDKFHAKSKARNIASITASHAPVVSQVFSERTSFENLLHNQEALKRDPASMNPTARIIGVKKDIALTYEEQEKLLTDYILSTGTGGGIQLGNMLKVSRKLVYVDPYLNNQQKEITIPFATLKVVFADKDIAIARLESIQSTEDGLNLGYRSILIGDYVSTN